MKEWPILKKVMDCEFKGEWIDCPRCGLREECYHEDGGEECTEEQCPRFKSRKES